MENKLTELEQEVFDYLNATPNAREARLETLAARISHEMDVRYSEALVIVEKWSSSLKIIENPEYGASNEIGSVSSQTIQ